MRNAICGGLVAVGCFVATEVPSVAARQISAADIITRPLVSEDASPLESIAPTMSEGSRGEGFLRKPPGPGPFPAVVLVHGGIARWPGQQLREYALGTWASRFLAAGYVVGAITYRSRDIDPQSPQVALEQILAGSWEIS